MRAALGAAAPRATCLAALCAVAGAASALWWLQGDGQVPSVLAAVAFNKGLAAPTAASEAPYRFVLAVAAIGGDSSGLLREIAPVAAARSFGVASVACTEPPAETGSAILSDLELLAVCHRATESVRPLPPPSGAQIHPAPRILCQRPVVLLDRFPDSPSDAVLGLHPLGADADALLRWALRRVASQLPQLARTVRTASGLNRAVDEAVGERRAVVALRDVPRRGGALEAAAAEAVGELLASALSRQDPATFLRLPAVANIGPYAYPLSGRAGTRCVYASLLDVGAVAAGAATAAEAWSEPTPLCSREDAETARTLRAVAVQGPPAAAMVALRRAWVLLSAAVAALQPRRALRALIRRGWTPLGVGAACVALEGALLRLRPVRVAVCCTRARVFALFGAGAAVAVAAFTETAAQGAHVRGRRHAPEGPHSSEELAIGAVSVLVVHALLCAFALHQHANEVFAATGLARQPPQPDPAEEQRRRRERLDAIAPCGAWQAPAARAGEPCAICLSPLDAPGPAPQRPPAEAPIGGGEDAGKSWVRQLPCGHTFHSVCVESWLIERRRGNCPLCMQQVIAPEEGEGAEGEDEGPPPLVGWPPHRHAANGNVPAPWHL